MDVSNWNDSSICLLLSLCMVERQSSRDISFQVACKLSIYNDYNDEPVYAPEQPKGIFTWLSQSWLYAEDKLIKTHGLDAVMFTRFMRSALFICCILCLSSATVLFPVYATSGRHHLKSNDPLYTSGLELISMSNLQRNDPRMWASMLFEYIVVFTVLFFLFLDYRAYYQYRIRYRAQERPTNYALLLVDIPTSDDTLELVKECFNRMFPQDSPFVVPVLNFANIEKLHVELEKFLNRKERLEWRCSRDNPTNRGGERCNTGTSHIFSGANRSRLKKLQHFNEMIREKKIQIATETRRALKDSNANTLAFFVIFFHKSQAAFARQTCLFEKTTQWVISSAPDPKGIHWDAFSWSLRSCWLRKCLSIASILVLIIFWTIPVTFVSSLANINTLSHVKALTWLSFITKISPSVVAFLDGILPAVILVVLFSLVPWILDKILLRRRDFSLVHIQSQVQLWYTVFLVVQVFFVYTIGGSIFGNLQAMIQNPSNIPNLLSESIPKQGLFYMNFILIQGLVGFSISLLLIGRLFVRWFKLHWTAKTEREKDQIIANAIHAFPYSSHYGSAFIIVFLCLMYSVMSPFILFFGCIYFVWGLCVTKYQLIYVNVSLYEAGGVHFPTVFYSYVITLVLQQLVMMAVFGINQFGPGFLIFPLPFLTLLYAKWVLGRFGTVSEHGAVITLVDKDDSSVPVTYSELYKHPIWTLLNETEDPSTV
ncbi:hypothetical protein GpartN1_g7007.t1 [Galdieria partita]|uniref:Uncharacterized protein n=1 Tax=Galdieria partita TaxID=83374 RepID=A0A9C7Q2V2_9RHOD|nr:hypothetical protein GpartN1_g6489.t1 [Galdieria partita]GJQ15216.1 hypothetical protein GpartN1_g7007.t1 [Galdieria partita]